MYAKKIKKNNCPRVVVRTRPNFNNHNPNTVEVYRFDIKNKYSEEVRYIFALNKNNANLMDARKYNRHEFAVKCFFSEIVDLKINLKYARNVQKKHLSQVFESLMRDNKKSLFPFKIMDSMQIFFSMIE